MLTNIEVPSHLKGEAKKIYERVVQQCFTMKILAEIDTDALAIYAFEYAELIRLQQQLKREGYTIEQETKSGVVTVANPLDRIVTKKIATVNAIGSQFGWSPVSRVRLLQIAKGEDKKNDFYDLINGKD
jgi:P27 family predicted phage terminase small subunit